LYSLGRSSYSSDNMPSFQVTMLRGNIASSAPVHNTLSAFDPIFIPQVDIEFTIQAKLKNELNNPSFGKEFTSKTYDNGNYVELSFIEPIIHLKEFNSFYEKDNFEIEAFLIQTNNELTPLKMPKKMQMIVNDILLDVKEGTARDEGELFFDVNEYVDTTNLAYYFDIEADTEIPNEELCKAVDNLEINSQFLDEELICPDQRTDRFDIYATRVGPEDLEDCNDDD